MQPRSNKWLFIPVGFALLCLIASLWSALGPDLSRDRANLASPVEDAANSDKDPPAPVRSPAMPVRGGRRSS